METAPLTFKPGMDDIYLNLSQRNYMGGILAIARTE